MVDELIRKIIENREHYNKVTALINNRLKNRFSYRRILTYPATNTRVINLLKICKTAREYAKYRSINLDEFELFTLDSGKNEDDFSPENFIPSRFLGLKIFGDHLYDFKHSSEDCARAVYPYFGYANQIMITNDKEFIESIYDYVRTYFDSAKNDLSNKKNIIKSNRYIASLLESILNSFIG